MSRLDSFLRRLTAQAEALAFAARQIADLPGPVLELGLGHGRTYDHLKTLLPERAIYVFEREPTPSAARLVDPAMLVVGDFRATLPNAPTGARAALVHGDVGSGRAALDAALAEWLGPVLRGLIRPGGYVLTDQSLPPGDWERPDFTTSVKRYHCYRAPLG